VYTGKSIYTDVSEDLSASIFRVQELAKQGTSKKKAFSLLLAPYLAYSSILKMEAIRSSQTPEYFYHATWPHILEDSTVKNHRRENLKSNIIQCYILYDFERLWIGFWTGDWIY
jgi:hypothetical protein